MQKNGKLLIVEDNPEILQALQFFLENEFSLITSISNPNLIPSTLQGDQYDLVLLDMNFTAGINTGNEGIFWLAEILKIDPTLCVIMMTAYGDIDLAVKAIKNGATDFILKPWDNDKLLATLNNGLKLRKSTIEFQKNRENQDQLNADLEHQFHEFIGECPAIRRVLDIVEKVSQTDANILITGENGTGKGMIAREIHRLSARAKKPMVTVDMSTIPVSLFESELFGHKKGAFTDAKKDRIGRFETANQSTLFLDEIGNLSLNMQTKILNVLQERQVIPLGSNKSIPIDVRLLCATNKNLEKMVMEGLFRQDLLFRINTIQIDLPPLRERGHDIELMAGYFLDKFSVKYGKGQMLFDRDAVLSLKNYQWPGNIRELEHTIEKAVILADRTTVHPDDLFLKKIPFPSMNIKDAPASFNEYEKNIIRNALLRNLGNLSNAAKELGISRPTMYRKMKQYDL
ncbi:MAG: sigma-54 dependent transcriptional regulator [Bacteroidales bacterium]|nr:sigma-54 dependent transcriptional regulator [Bacteroidales bacterium]MDD4604222.1 sigma-54 dependent transcriptional regulator [Bacteroidales bacterium]